MKVRRRKIVVSSQNKKTTALAIIIIVLCPLLLALSAGDQAPDIALPDLKGNKVAFPDDFRGKVVMIRFWKAMCHHCVREMPAIETVFNKYKDNGFVVLAINVGQPKEDVEGFLSGMTVTYPVLLDLYSVAAKRYGFVSSPTTYVVDRNGVVKETFFGEVEGKVYEKIIGSLL
ncbi:MAG: TlpA family protein disulfide reductase [Nitrospirae bacterium]|nr:TlpA family protein disulfide reductase [Nitrospirota bacterium]